MQRNRKYGVLTILAATLVLGASQAAYGSTIPAGTIDGSNDDNIIALTPHGSPPVLPSRLVIDSPNVSGSGTEAIFNFDPSLTTDSTPGYDSNHFFQVVADQFRFEVDFDLDGSNAHTFSPVNYNGSTGVSDGGENVVWAITGNLGNRTNSILRGSSMTFLADEIGNTHEFNISGKLFTDGLFHWYGDIDGDGTFLDDDTSTLASFLLEDYLLFSGTISNIDDPDSSNFDTYSVNSINVSFVNRAVAVPAPSPLALMGLGVVLMMLMLRTRKKQNI